MDFYIETIMSKSVRPILDISLENVGNNTFDIKVLFSNNLVKRRINPDLRHFFITMKDVSFIKTVKEEKYCLKSQVKLFDIFGIVKGDTIVFTSLDTELYTFFI